MAGSALKKLRDEMDKTVLWRGREFPALLPGVEYDDAAHRYTVNGQEWKSATQRLYPLHGYVGDISAGAGWGSAAHDHVFCLMNGTLDMDRVDERMRPTLEGWKAALKHFNLRGAHPSIFQIGAPFLSEYIIYSKRLRVIGRFDFMFETWRTDLLMDLKTGSPSDRETRITGIQLGIYAQGLIEHKFTTPARLRTAEINIQMDGTMKPHEYNTREIMAAAAGYLTYDSYITKI